MTESIITDFDFEAERDRQIARYDLSATYRFQTGFTEDAKHNGRVGTIRPLPTEQYDAEVGAMFVLTFQDGVSIQVFADELTRLD
jgi:hypothetical protein